MLFIKRSSILLSFILLIFNLFLLKREPINNNVKENLQIDNNYIIEIPKINLNVYFSNETTLDNGLEINEISKDEKKPLIISGHSGPGINVYFNELEYLNIGDDVIISHNNQKKYFNVNNIIYFKKFSEIVLPNDANYLYLITCDKYDMQKQLLISAKLSRIVEN